MKEILANKHTVHIHVSELTEEETARMVIAPLGELEPFDSSSVGDRLTAAIMEILQVCCRLGVESLPAKTAKVIWERTQGSFPSHLSMACRG